MDAFLCVQAYASTCAEEHGKSDCTDFVPDFILPDGRIYRKLRGIVGCVGTSGIGRTDIVVCAHEQQGSRGNVHAGVPDVNEKCIRRGSAGSASCRF